MLKINAENMTNLELVNNIPIPELNDQTIINAILTNTNVITNVPIPELDDQTVVDAILAENILPKNTIVVDQNGSGQYTTIQDAIDSVDTSTNDYLIKINPGDYIEDINILKGGITLKGSSKDLVIINGSFYGNSGCVVEDLTITGTGGKNYLVFMENTDEEFHFNNCKLIEIGISNRLITVHHGNYYFDNCEIYHESTASFPIIESVLDSTSTFETNLQITNCDISFLYTLNYTDYIFPIIIHGTSNNNINYFKLINNRITISIGITTNSYEMKPGIIDIQNGSNIIADISHNVFFWSYHNQEPTAATDIILYRNACENSQFTASHNLYIRQHGYANYDINYIDGMTTEQIINCSNEYIRFTKLLTAGSFINVNFGSLQLESPHHSLNITSTNVSTKNTNDYLNYPDIGHLYIPNLRDYGEETGFTGNLAFNPSNGEIGWT